MDAYVAVAIYIAGFVLMAFAVSAWMAYRHPSTADDALEYIALAPVALLWPMTAPVFALGIAMWALLRPASKLGARLRALKRDGR